MEIKELENKISEVLYHETLSFGDEYRIEEDIEEAKEEGLSCVRYTIELERILISWDNKENYKVENISTRDKETIEKIYAISEVSSRSIQFIINNNLIDNYVFYKGKEKDEIINQWIEDGADMSYEELEKCFGKTVFYTEFGYIERVE